MIYCVLLNPTIDKLIEICDFRIGGTYKIEQDQIHEFPLGKAISVALTLKTLGENPQVFALIGREEIPQYEQFLELKEINYKLFSVGGKTRSNLSIIDKNKVLTTHLRMPGFEFELEPFLKLKSNLLDSINKEDFVVISGSIPPLMDISYFNEFIKEIKSKTLKFIIDSSGEPLNHLLEYSPFIIKSNLEEMREIFKLNEEELPEVHDYLDNDGIKILIKPLFSRLKKMNTKFNVITLAKFGSILLKDTNLLYSYLDLDNDSNTVGCGDAFLAGLVFGLANNYDDEKCLRLATACGAANTQKIGAGILELDDIEKFEKMID